MTINSYSTLQTAVSDRLQRADMSASSTVVAEFIAFAEAEMNRRLKTTDMQTRNTSFPVNAEYVPVPSDFLQVRQIWLNTDPRVQLRFMPSELMNQDYPTGTNTPQYWCVEGGNFRFTPVPDATTYTASLVYYAKIPALSSTQTTNWLLAAHPDAYLYGALVQGAIRKQDQDAAQGYGALFNGVLQQIQSANRQLRWSGPGLVVMPG